MWCWEGQGADYAGSRCPACQPPSGWWGQLGAAQADTCGRVIHHGGSPGDSTDAELASRGSEGCTPSPAAYVQNGSLLPSCAIPGGPSTRWTEVRSARCPSQAHTVCHLPDPSWNRPRQTTRYGQCWAWPVPFSAWIMRKHWPEVTAKQLA